MRVDSPRRVPRKRSCSSLVEALSRLLAPILAFTADEAWEFSGATSSVHLELFPAVVESFDVLMPRRAIDDWLNCAAFVGQAVEPARQEKLIGNALEATVTIAIPDADALRANDQARLQELEEFLILSEVKIVQLALNWRRRWSAPSARAAPAAGGITRASVRIPIIPTCATAAPACWCGRRRVVKAVRSPLRFP